MTYLGALWNLLPFVRLRPNPAILDVGSGTGINLLEAARVLGGGGRLLGIDLSPGMVQVARSKATALGVAADFAVGDGEDLKLPDASFDLVICNSVLHWFNDPDRAIAGFARVLRPNGQLLIATLAAPAFTEWTQVVSAAWARRLPTARHGWFPEMPNASAVQAAVANAGFALECFKYQVHSVVVREIPPFVASMAVISPNWLGPEREAAHAISEEVTRELTRKLPGGFSITNANVDVVARKPDPEGTNALNPAPDLRHGSL
jgi:SAM-dependent methyltransferase